MSKRLRERERDRERKRETERLVEALFNKNYFNSIFHLFLAIRWQPSCICLLFAKPCRRRLAVAAETLRVPSSDETRVGSPCLLLFVYDAK